MGRLIVNEEELEINEELKVKLVSYEGGGSPYRILSSKNEFVILDSNNYGALHGKTNENGSLTVTYMDPSLEMTVDKGIILISNSEE